MLVQPITEAANRLTKIKCFRFEELHFSLTRHNRVPPYQTVDIIHESLLILVEARVEIEFVLIVALHHHTTRVGEYISALLLFPSHSKVDNRINVQSKNILPYLE